MPREIKEDVDLIRIDRTGNVRRILLVRAEIPPPCHKRLKEFRILIRLAKVVSVNLEAVRIKAREERPDKILHDVRMKVSRDIADADFFLLSSPRVRIRLHIWKEISIAETLPIDILGGQIDGIQAEKNPTVKSTPYGNIRDILDTPPHKFR